MASPRELAARVKLIHERQQLLEQRIEEAESQGELDFAAKLVEIHEKHQGTKDGLISRIEQTTGREVLGDGTITENAVDGAITFELTDREVLEQAGFDVDALDDSQVAAHMVDIRAQQAQERAQQENDAVRALVEDVLGVDVSKLTDAELQQLIEANESKFDQFHVRESGVGDMDRSGFTDEMNKDLDRLLDATGPDIDTKIPPDLADRVQALDAVGRGGSASGPDDTGGPGGGGSPDDGGAPDPSQPDDVDAGFGPVTSPDGKGFTPDQGDAPPQRDASPDTTPQGGDLDPTGPSPDVQGGGAPESPPPPDGTPVNDGPQGGGSPAADGTGENVDIVFSVAAGMDGTTVYPEGEGATEQGDMLGFHRSADGRWFSDGGHEVTGKENVALLEGLYKQSQENEEAAVEEFGPEVLGDDGPRRGVVDSVAVSEKSFEEAAEEARGDTSAGGEASSGSSGDGSASDGDGSSGSDDSGSSDDDTTGDGSADGSTTDGDGSAGADDGSSSVEFNPVDPNAGFVSAVGTPFERVERFERIGSRGGDDIDPLPEGADGTDGAGGGDPDEIKPVRPSDDTVIVERPEPKPNFGSSTGAGAIDPVDDAVAIDPAAIGGAPIGSGALAGRMERAGEDTGGTSPVDDLAEAAAAEPLAFGAGTGRVGSESVEEAPAKGDVAPSEEASKLDAAPSKLDDGTADSVDAVAPLLERDGGMAGLEALERSGAFDDIGLSRDTLEPGDGSPPARGVDDLEPDADGFPDLGP